ncbi:MAG: hypothetical protein M4579_006517 [Chaenotheca gracillima]|nr:MAG: hypothetical protein M4579_006517 [Chaenotheca gracillima]
MDAPVTILIFKAVNDLASGALDLPHNQGRLVPLSSLRSARSRINSGAPSADGSLIDVANPEKIDPDRRTLQLTFDLPPKDPSRGFVFGTDPDICDVLLGRSGSYVSGRHFHIDFDKQHKFVLRNESSQGTVIEAIEGYPVRLMQKATYTLPPESESIKLSLPDNQQFSMRCGSPSRRESRAYKSALQRYLEAHEDGFPAVASLSVKQKDPTLVSGQEIDIARFEEVKELGHGGFGTVRLYKDRSGSHTLAAKQLNGSVDYNDILTEARFLRGFDHEHIVKYVAFRAEPLPTLYMEYLPLGNLRQQKDISRHEVVRTCYQALKALEYLHHRGFTHRDISPANILVATREPLIHVKLADFGLSKDVSDMTSALGTPGYSAPEISPGRLYHQNVDIWSLGVALFVYLLDRRVAGLSTTKPSNGVRKLREMREEDQFILLISKMLEKNPRLRPYAKACLQIMYDYRLLFSEGTPRDEDLQGSQSGSEPATTSSLSTVPQDLRKLTSALATSAGPSGVACGPVKMIRERLELEDNVVE